VFDQSTGGALAAAAAAGGSGGANHHSSIVQMSVWWQVPQYLAVGLSEVGAGAMGGCWVGEGSGIWWVRTQWVGGWARCMLASGRPIRQPASPLLPVRPAPGSNRMVLLPACLPVPAAGVHLHRAAGAVLRPGPRCDALLLHGPAAAVGLHWQLPLRWVGCALGAFGGEGPWVGLAWPGWSRHCVCSCGPAAGAVCIGSYLSGGCCHPPAAALLLVPVAVVAFASAGTRVLCASAPASC
jgi:hypothetical protein